MLAIGLWKNCELDETMGIGRGGQRGAFPPLNFEIISKKRLFFQFQGVKNKFHQFWPPWKKFWENPLLPPPSKKSFRRPWMRHMIGLPYLQKQNSWKSQWLLFATTNKRYTAFFTMFLQLPIHGKTASLSLFRQNYCGRWKQPKMQKLTLSSSQHIHIVSS